MSAGVGVSAPAAAAPRAGDGAAAVAGPEVGVAADGVLALGTGVRAGVPGAAGVPDSGVTGVPARADVGVAAADGGRDASSPSSRNFLGLINRPLLLT